MKNELICYDEQIVAAAVFRHVPFIQLTDHTKGSIKGVVCVVNAQPQPTVFRLSSVTTRYCRYFKANQSMFSQDRDRPFHGSLGPYPSRNLRHMDHRSTLGIQPVLGGTMMAANLLRWSIERLYVDHVRHANSCFETLGTSPAHFSWSIQSKNSHDGGNRLSKP